MGAAAREACTGTSAVLVFPPPAPSFGIGRSGALALPRTTDHNDYRGPITPPRAVRLLPAAAPPPAPPRPAGPPPRCAPFSSCDTSCSIRRRSPHSSPWGTRPRLPPPRHLAQRHKCLRASGDGSGRALVGGQTAHARCSPRARPGVSLAPPQLRIDPLDPSGKRMRARSSPYRAPACLHATPLACPYLVGIEGGQRKALAPVDAQPRARDLYPRVHARDSAASLGGDTSARAGAGAGAGGGGRGGASHSRHKARPSALSASPRRS